MFLHLSVILFTEGRSLSGGGESVQAFSVQGVSVWEVSAQGGFCPGGSLLGGVSIQGDLCPGGSLSGIPPPYSYVRAVCILLECILVLYQVHFTCLNWNTFSLLFVTETDRAERDVKSDFASVAFSTVYLRLNPVKPNVTYSRYGCVSLWHTTSKCVQLLRTCISHYSLVQIHVLCGKCLSCLKLNQSERERKKASLERKLRILFTFTLKNVDRESGVINFS